MDELKIEDLENREEEVDDYVPEDPNAPVDDFEEAEVQIEDFMSEDLKNAIRRYNEIHKRTMSDLNEKDEDLEEDEDMTEDSGEVESEIVEDDSNDVNLNNLFWQIITWLV